jgi:hypothetical protein
MPLNTLHPAEAYSIASQWGSFVRLGDPGAVFYTFPVDDARPKTEAQRKALLGYTERCIRDVAKRRRRASTTKAVDDCARDYCDLAALHLFFQDTPLRELSS